MIPYPKTQSEKAYNAVDELNMDLALIHSDSFTDLELKELFYKINEKFNEFFITCDTYTIMYDSTFLEAVYKAFLKKGYRATFPETYFTTQYVTGFDLVNKIILFNDNAIIMVLEAQKLKEEEEKLLRQKSISTHQAMLSKIVKGGYNNLSAEDQSYWNSVY